MGLPRFSTWFAHSFVTLIEYVKRYASNLSDDPMRDSDESDQSDSDENLTSDDDDDEANFFRWTCNFKCICDCKYYLMMVNERLNRCVDLNLNKFAS